MVFRRVEHRWKTWVVVQVFAIEVQNIYFNWVKKIFVLQEKSGIFSSLMVILTLICFSQKDFSTVISVHLFNFYSHLSWWLKKQNKTYAIYLKTKQKIVEIQLEKNKV